MTVIRMTSPRMSSPQTNISHAANNMAVPRMADSVAAPTPTADSAVFPSAEGITLRVHHLLCIPLFAGHGYSDGFCRNMERVIRLLREQKDAPLTVVCSADLICSGCPNRTPEGGCRNCGSSKSKRSKNTAAQNSVVQKDRLLADALGIVPGRSYTFRQLCFLAGSRLSEQIFNDSCHNCQWFQQGLCSYKAWKRNIDQMIL